MKDLKKCFNVFKKHLISVILQIAFISSLSIGTFDSTKQVSFTYLSCCELEDSKHHYPIQSPNCEDITTKNQLGGVPQFFEYIQGLVFKAHTVTIHTYTLSRYIFRPELARKPSFDING
ncbi:hypothetical protein J3Q64DRAFT_1695110 [Phycomyces blakesleeanus]|uniref:Uncharacterized protein n=2 Tax=Phycomyces blakesleeanus TaxID=4837 RepID=A0A167K0E6_PHYB8|nr:hypothetical protein PHYBLDRAFT_70376 [Phycomyces blakesleeanus NRRL 1555(-)]OAD67017.1 hypothetical protein PHYBLDRAFT_70376 [Phycomyces blakesleeanus NRRL 1555(-)]|eukprot:XP_018285057.1 hypothetical protein PHYBLDRAFT_70376 [Phycomyces blakesleeanus NRRL 1555(-)]